MLSDTSASRRQLRITIDGRAHVVTDSDQEAAALLRLAGRDPHGWDLFLVDENGVEVEVRDLQIINLRDDAAFVSRRKVRFTIDGEPHVTYDDDQTAAALLRLAGVDPAGYDLVQVLTTGAPQTLADGAVVKIQDGDEFVTAKHVGGVA